MKQFVLQYLWKSSFLLSLLSIVISYFIFVIITGFFVYILMTEMITQQQNKKHLCLFMEKGWNKNSSIQGDTLELYRFNDDGSKVWAQPPPFFM